MRFVVEHDDLLHAHQVRHDPLKHLPLGLLRGQLLAPALKKRATALRKIKRLSELEGVVIRDDDLGTIEIAEHLVWHKLPALVVTVWVVRMQDAQPIANGDAGSNDEEPACELRTIWPSDRVDGLPRDQHRHDRRLASTGRELEGESREARVGLLIGDIEMLEQTPAFLTDLRGHLRQPDGYLDSLDLTEERPDVVELVVAPVLQEANRLWCHLPCGWIGDSTPGINAPSNFVDDRCGVILLLRSREP